MQAGIVAQCVLAAGGCQDVPEVTQFVQEFGPAEEEGPPPTVEEQKAAARKLASFWNR